MVKCKIAVESEQDCQMCCCFCDKKESCEDVCGEITSPCEEMVEERTELQVMNSAVPDVLKAITDITIQMDKLKKQEEVFRKKLVQAMEEHGIKKFENDKVSFTYKAPTTRTSIDSTRLKKEHPEIAEQYSKTSPVSASVTIKVK